MKSPNPILEERQAFGSSKIEELINRISKIQHLKELGDYCIYVTGSFARYEATSYSDLDLFFIKSGKSDDADSMSLLTKTLIDADLIKISREMGFPDFSGDGKFLQIHYLEDIKSNLGSPEDDYSNYFTARLLLFLESKPLFNETFYDKAVVEMIDTYFRDYPSHENDFIPVFLVNDIIRYWKTLCLNYEHRRNRPQEDDTKRKKTHIKNLKLAFSRKLTCYSFILNIIPLFKKITTQDLLQIVKRTPLQRLEWLIVHDNQYKDKVVELMDLYAWFINLNDRPENDLIDWFRIESNKKEAFDRGRDFGSKLFSLLRSLTNQNEEILKYLVI